MFLFVGGAAAQTSWWDDDWQSRQKVVVVEQSGYNLSDYPLVFTLHHNGLAQPDCDDIRVISEGNQIEHAQHNCTSSTVDIAVKQDLKAASNASLYVYYENPNAGSSAADWNDVRYNFYDDFEDGDMSNWTDVEHPEFWSERNGKIYYEPSTSAGSIGDNMLWAHETLNGSNGALEWPLAIEIKAIGRHTSASLGASASIGGLRDKPHPVRMRFQDDAYNPQRNPRIWNSLTNLTVFNDRRANNVWYTYRLVADPANDTVRLYRDNQVFNAYEPRDAPADNVSIALNGRTCWGCGGTGDREYEYIKVWKHMTPSPKIAIGSRMENAVEADVEFRPETLNKKSNGRFVTAYIELPENVSRINISTVKLEGGPDAVDDPKFGFVKNPEAGDRDGDGLPETMVKFERQNVLGMLEAGQNVELVVSGKTANNTLFMGQDTVRFIGSSNAPNCQLPFIC